MIRYSTAVVLILFAALSRLLPHPPNFAPVTAIALFGAVYLNRKQAFIVPMIAMLLSDLFLGFHPGMAWVYGAFLLITLIGFWLKRHQGLMTTVAASFAGSIVFFLVTNFGMWVVFTEIYPRSAAGLLEAYALAIPFFRNTILGDLLYTGLLFGGFELAKRYIPAFRHDPDVVEAQ